MITQFKKLFFYNVFYPTTFWISQLLPKKISFYIIDWLLNQNNKIVLANIHKTPKKILILLPKCLQYFHCDKNLIASIDNCIKCGKCKIKDIIQLKQRYKIELKIVPGGEMAKSVVKELKPEYVIAVACKPELLAGLKSVHNYNVVVIPNTIVEKPCINTDVEIKKIENFISKVIK